MTADVKIHWTGGYPRVEGINVPNNNTVVQSSSGEECCVDTNIQPQESKTAVSHDLRAGQVTHASPPKV